MGNSIVEPHRVTVDLDQSVSLDSFVVNQLNRSTDEVEISVVRRGMPIDITRCTVRISIKKPSELTVFEDCEIISEFPAKVWGRLSNQSIIEVGTHTAEVMIFYEEEKVSVSGIFRYSSRGAIFNDETLESKNDWTAIHNALLNYISKDEADQIISEIIRNMSADGTLPIDLSAYLKDYLTAEEIKELFVENKVFEEHIDNEDIHLNEADVVKIIDENVSVIKGPQGLSAFDVAVENGFIGTEEEWLMSLTGSPGIDGLSAYQIAVLNGFEGTEEEWLASLVGRDGDSGEDGDNGQSAFEIAVSNGFTGTEEEWLASLVGEPGPPGESVDVEEIEEDIAFIKANAQMLKITRDDGTFKEYVETGQDLIERARAWRKGFYTLSVNVNVINSPDPTSVLYGFCLKPNDLVTILQLYSGVGEFYYGAYYTKWSGWNPDRRPPIQITDWDTFNPATLGLQPGETQQVWSAAIESAPWGTSNAVAGFVTRVNSGATQALQVTVMRGGQNVSFDATSVATQVYNPQNPTGQGWQEMVTTGFLKKVLGGELQVILDKLHPNKHEADPDIEIYPTDLSFKRSAVQRNFFNSKKILSRLDLSSDIFLSDTNMYPNKNITAQGLNVSQEKNELALKNPITTSESREETYARFGQLFPYSVIDFKVLEQNKTSYTANIVLSFLKDADNKLLIAVKGNSNVSLEVFKNGTQAYFRNTVSASLVAPYTLRVHVTGRYIHILQIKDGETKYLSQHDVSSYFDLREISVYKNFNIFIGARLGPLESVRLTGIEHYLTGGTGQADPRLLHYADGTPIMEGGKLWFAMTTRGYNDIPASYQGIYSLDLDTFTWELTGMITFDVDGVLKPWHATDVLYEEETGNWLLFTTSHGDDHGIWSAVSNKDPRFGITIVEPKKVNYPSVGNEEDASIVYDDEAEKWRMAYVKGTSGYKLFLAESDTWDGEYVDIANTTTTSATGSLIQKIGGKRYVFIGRGVDNFEVYSYPNLQLLGTIDYDEKINANNVWPVIFPLRNGHGTKYKMLTFDRGKITGNYSYGALYLYEAMEVSSGTEYPRKRHLIPNS